MPSSLVINLYIGTCVARHQYRRNRANARRRSSDKKVWLRPMQSKHSGKPAAAGYFTNQGENTLHRQTLRSRSIFNSSTNCAVFAEQAVPGFMKRIPAGAALSENAPPACWKMPCCGYSLRWLTCGYRACRSHRGSGPRRSSSGNPASYDACSQASANHAVNHDLSCAS